MIRHDERGIALVLSLFLMAAMSVLSASLMFLSQTETYASMNYRMMSQTRYAGEAAVQKAANFLLDPAQYTEPTPTEALDPLLYDRTTSPVLFGGEPVVLSADPDVDSNYPAAAMQTAFAAAAQGTLAADNTTLGYRAYATLVAMQVFDSYGGGSEVVQTWEITGVGQLDAGSRTAVVEVSGTIETPKVPANNYAAFATDDTCGAMYFHGNVTINSYDSRVAGGPAASTEDTGGDVGTNGNLTIEGSVEVQGNLYTPRTGVGTCEDGAVVALTETGAADVTGSVVQLPTAVAFPAPTFTVTPPTNTVTIDGSLLGNHSTACSSLGLTLGVNCSISGNTVTVDGNGTDVTMPSVVVDNGFTLVFAGNSTPAQVVNINSLSGEGDIEVAANMTGANNESVVLKVAGLDSMGDELAVPFDLSQMSWKQNSPSYSYDASALQIVYGGSGTIEMKGGNSQSAVTIYAPNADFELRGTQDLFGSVLARTIENHGNAGIHYDRRLASDFWVAGQPMASTFTWKRY